MYLWMRRMRAGQWGHCWGRWEALLVTRRAPVRSAAEKLASPIPLRLGRGS